METFLDFEKPIETLEKKLKDLQELSSQDGVDLSNEIHALEKKTKNLIEETYSSLSPWQKVLVSRHPNRPYTRDYIEALFPSFTELHGDRNFSDDPAIMAGVADWPPVEIGQDPSKNSPPVDSVIIIGHQKGRTTKQKMLRNFGMAKPEGYRKAMRLFELAERSRLPILTFIDTPGAYPGLETEERGQAQAIAESIRMMAGLSVPIASVVIGEGGSGGALALGVANLVLMNSYSTYSVISPEGCASILWSDAKLASQASEKLKMSPQDLIQLGIIDDIIPEPAGGAHRNWPQMFQNLRKALISQFGPMIESRLPKSSTQKKATTTAKKAKTTAKKRPGKLRSIPTDFRQHRLQKFRNIGNTAFDTIETKPSKRVKS